MMKNTIRTFIMSLCIPFMVQAQSENAFLGRNFWSANTTLEEVNQKIAEGNDPAKLNPSGFNGIVYALLAETKDDIIIDLLERENTDVNLISHDGRTYLHWAAMGGHLEVMKYLVEAGIKKPVIDDHGYTELTFAATTRQTNHEVYDFLLDNGSKITATNHDGANALLLLIPYLEDFTMVDYFTEKGLELSDKDKSGNGVFYYAAKTGNLKMLDKLIEKGVDYKGLNKEGGNAMIAASMGTRYVSNSLEVFKYLENKGIKPNVVTKEGVTPLHILAGGSQDKAVLNYFIDKGVDVNKVSEEGNTALMNSAYWNELEIVKFFGEKTKNINISNKDGNTALSNAVAGNSPEVVSYLLEKGAKANVVDKKGNNLTFYLVQSYRPGQTEGFEKKFELLKKAGVDFKAAQSKDNTMFHLAAEENDLYLLKKANSLGLDVNKANAMGSTPLQIAAMKASDDVILKYLLEIGADKGVVTDFEESVYDLASENQALAQNNVDINFLK